MKDEKKKYECEYNFYDSDMNMIIDTIHYLMRLSYHIG